MIQPDATRAADDEPAPESPAAGRSFPADLVVPLVLVLVPLWMTRHALQAYMPAGVDIGGHLVRTEFALELFRQGRLDGWFPGFGLGYRLFAVNGPGLALATGLVRLVCLGTITTAQAFTVLGIVSFATLPWAVAALGRELGASRLGSWLLGLLSLAVSFGAGGGLAALYRTGLLPNNLALPLQLVTLVALIRLVRDGGRRRAAIAALLVAALALLHPISVVVLALFAPLLLVSTLLRDPVRSAGRAFGAMLWAAALAAFWLLPALGHRDELGDATGWSIPPLPTRLGQILRGELLLPRAISVAVVVTLVATLLLALRQPAMRYRLLGPLAAVLYLTATHLALGHGFGPFELLIHLPNRGLALATILLMQPLAELVADVAGRLGRRVAAAPALASVAVGLAVPGLVGGKLDPPQAAREPSASLERAADHLSRVVPSMGRHLFVKPPVDVGTDQPVRWLAAASGTNSAHLFFWEATREYAAGELANDLLARVEPANAVSSLRRFGVSHVVVAGSGHVDELTGVLGLRPSWSDGPITIFEVLPGPGEPPPSALLQPAPGERDEAEPALAAASTAQQPERLEWRTEADRPVEVVAAVAFDPGWRAEVDGKFVATARSSEGLVRWKVPAGEHEVALVYATGGADRLVLLISLAALLAATVSLTPWRRARSRGGPGAPGRDRGVAGGPPVAKSRQ